MKSILEMMNFEERVAVLSRIVDILMVRMRVKCIKGSTHYLGDKQDFEVSTLTSRIALQVERKVASCESAFTY